MFFQLREKYLKEFERILSQSNNVEVFKSISTEFNESDFEALNNIVKETQDWYAIKKEEQAKLLDNQDPLFTVSELKEKVKIEILFFKKILGIKYRSRNENFNEQNVFGKN